MRQDIAFNAEGTALRGWLFTPHGAKSPAPTVVMAHGFSAVKEMFLDAFAEIFARAGLGVLVFDHRNARRVIRSDFIGALQAQFDEDRRGRFAGKPPSMIPVVAENLLEPKKLTLIPGGHFDAYGAAFETTSAAARDWFVEHLQPARTR